MLRDGQRGRRPRDPAADRAARRLPHRRRAPRDAHAGRRRRHAACARPWPDASLRASPRTGSSSQVQDGRPRPGPTPTRSTRSSPTWSRTRCATATGTITVGVRPVPRAATEVTVGDEGTGIPEEVASRVFTGSGAATSAAAPASGSTSSRGWSRRTAARSRWAARPAVARGSASCCPPGHPPTSLGTRRAPPAPRAPPARPRRSPCPTCSTPDALDRARDRRR